MYLCLIANHQKVLQWVYLSLQLKFIYICINYFNLKYTCYCSEQEYANNEHTAHLDVEKLIIDYATFCIMQELNQQNT